MKRGARALFFDMQRLALVVWLLALPALALGAGASEVFEKVKDAVVVVKAIGLDGQEVGQGSGVVLPSGQVATNNHVVEQGVRFQVVAKGQAVSAVVVAKKADRDLALLLAPGLDARPAQLGRAGGLKVGQKVFAVGAPYGLELSLSEGIVSQLRGGKPPIIQTTAAISPGSSGGGLFNEQGQLVGITTFYFKEAQGLNFAVPVEWLGGLIAQSEKAEAPPEAKSPKATPKTTSPPVRPSQESSEDWEDRARALSAAEDWAGLLEHSKRWTKAQPKEPMAWGTLGVAYCVLGRYQEAVKALKEALRLKPDYAEAWANLGIAYSKLGRYQEEVNAYKEALRLKPDLAQAWNNLGLAYGKLGRWQEAVEANKEALRLKPDFAEAWNNLGLAYFGLGNRSEALKAVQELRRYDPSEADKLFNIIMGR